MRHGVPELETNDDLNFSAMAMAHSDKQISRQKTTIVFPIALVETKIVLYTCSSGVTEKQNELLLLAPCYFQMQQVLQFAFTLSPQLRT